MKAAALLQRRDAGAHSRLGDEIYTLPLLNRSPTVAGFKIAKPHRPAASGEALRIDASPSADCRPSPEAGERGDALLMSAAGAACSRLRRTG